jgi:hypothetical protein
VLTPRSEPYTVEDLLQLAPQTFLKMSDGSYLLDEHVIVMSRASLVLSEPGGLHLRLASGEDRFSTIVSLGGELEITGEQASPARISSWDPLGSAEDTTLTDGRAYLRAIGGQFHARFAEFSHLGFWSGRSGGLSLTGTDRPNTGAIESGPPAGGGEATLLDGVTWQPAGADQPGPAPIDDGYTVAAQSYVSGELVGVSSHHNAYGLFVSGANGLQVTGSEFADNSHGGVTLHRYVTNALITQRR